MFYLRLMACFFPAGEVITWRDHKRGGPFEQRPQHNHFNPPPFPHSSKHCAHKTSFTLGWDWYVEMSKIFKGWSQIDGCQAWSTGRLFSQLSVLKTCACVPSGTKKGRSSYFSLIVLECDAGLFNCPCVSHLRETLCAVFCRGVSPSLPVLSSPTPPFPTEKNLLAIMASMWWEREKWETSGLPTNFTIQ